MSLIAISSISATILFLAQKSSISWVSASPPTAEPTTLFRPASNANDGMVIPSGGNYYKARLQYDPAVSSSSFSCIKVTKYRLPDLAKSNEKLKKSNNGRKSVFFYKPALETYARLKGF